MKSVLALLTLVSLCATAAAGLNPDKAAYSDEHGNRVCVTAIAAAPEGARPVPLRGSCDAQWQALGPYGGDARDVAMSPTNADIVLAGIAPDGSSGGTLFRSTNGGSSWIEVSAVSGNSVYHIEFTPTGIAYIGTDNSVWKSSDDGASWTQLDLDIGANDTVLAVAIDPADENTVYIGVSAALGYQDQNVLRSTDAGSTWTDITPNVSSMGCTGIAINPNDSDNIAAVFSGSFSGGAAWVTTDGGSNWTNCSSGLPGNPLNDVAHDGTRILVCGGMAFGSQEVGLYASSDNGETWTALHDGSWTSLYINDIEVDANDVDTVYVAARGGVFKSVDGGATWEFGIGGSSALMVDSIRLDPGSSTSLFLGASSAAVWRSTDAGEEFLPSSVGIGQLDVYSVAVNPLDVDELAIAFQGLNDGGVYTSLDGGLTWTLEGNVPATRYNVVQFAADGTLYAISDGPSSIAPEGLYRRNLDGTWTELGPDQGSYFESELFAIHFGDSDPNLIMMGGSDFGYAGYESTIWRSVDTGASWTKVHEGTDDFEDVMAIEIAEDTQNQVMVAAFVDLSDQTGGALRSVDYGVTWTAASSGLESGCQGYGLGTSPADANTFYLADGDAGTGNGGLYITTDAGQTWTDTGYTGHQVSDVIVDPRDANVVYIMQRSDPDVRISEDGGATFADFNTGLEEAGTASDLFFADAYFPQLLLSTNTGTYVTELCRCPQEGCEADLTGDCVVNLSDLAALLSNYGSTGEIGDGDIAPPYDGVIDLTDLAYLLSQYGDDCN